MPTLLPALMLAAQPALPAAPFGRGRTATLFATIGHSEWCPAGNVRLDLASGDYAVTPRAERRICHQPGLERPVTRGRIEPGRLAELRRLYRRAQAEGLDGCSDGRRPKEIIVSNGGTPILLLTSGAATTSAPDDQSCWSGAARSLHDSLDAMFRSLHRR